MEEGSKIQFVILATFWSFLHSAKISLVLLWVGWLPECVTMKGMSGTYWQLSSLLALSLYHTSLHN